MDSKKDAPTDPTKSKDGQEVVPIEVEKGDVSDIKDVKEQLKSSKPEVTPFITEEDKESIQFFKGKVNQTKDEEGSENFKPSRQESALLKNEEVKESSKSSRQNLTVQADEEVKEYFESPREQLTHIMNEEEKELLKSTRQELPQYIDEEIIEPFKSPRQELTLLSDEKGKEHVKSPTQEMTQLKDEDVIEPFKSPGQKLTLHADEKEYFKSPRQELAQYKDEEVIEPFKSPRQELTRFNDEDRKEYVKSPTQELTQLKGEDRKDYVKSYRQEVTQFKELVEKEIKAPADELVSIYEDDEEEDEWFPCIREPKYTLLNPEDGEYDFISGRMYIHKPRFLESVTYFIKGFTGVGITSMHIAYKNVGLLTGLLLNFYIGLLVIYYIHVLIHSAQKMCRRVGVPRLSYPDLAEAVMDVSPLCFLKKHSLKFRYLVSGTLVVVLFASCSCCQIIAAKIVNEMLIEYEVAHDFMKERCIIVFFILPSLILSMVLTNKYLAPFSVVLVFIFGFIVLYTVLQGVYMHSRPVQRFPFFNGIGGYFRFIGTCLFSMEGAGVALQVENSLTDPHQMDTILGVGMGSVVGMVMLCGFYGYWAYGDRSVEPVTLNFGTNWLGTFLKFCNCICMYLTFAINFWTPFDILWYYIRRKHDPGNYWYVERLYRALFILVITGTSIAFPSLCNFMGVIGSLCVNTLCFVYPALIQLSMDLYDYGPGKHRWRWIRFILTVSFGAINIVFGTVFSFIALIKELYL